jgi:hypothetical protein
MEQLRIMQATILHMVQSAQIGCITPASEYNLLFTCLLYLYRSLFSAFHLDVLARFARTRVFPSQPVDHIPTTYLPRLALTMSLASPAKTKVVRRLRRAKTQSGRRLYSRLLPFLLRVCLFAYFFPFTLGICWR